MTVALSVKGSRILVIGVAYKPNVDDLRESPSAEIMEQLGEQGASLDYHDDYFPSFPKMRAYNFTLSNVALSEETLSSYDCVVIGTDHDYLDYDFILEHATLIVDCRGRYRGGEEKVIRA